MTPKEKSKDLLRLIGYETSPDFECLNIKLALICVDEIIKANPTEYNVHIMDGNEIDIVEESKAYWQQVKEELQKL